MGPHLYIGLAAQFFEDTVDQTYLQNHGIRYRKTIS
jgi:hypothetical protein